MAGPVRQPIDQASLERYLEKTAAVIKPPIELKQVSDLDVEVRLGTTY